MRGWPRTQAFGDVTRTDRQFCVPMTRPHPDLKQRRLIHEAEPIARPTGRGSIHRAKRIFNWRFASEAASCRRSPGSRNGGWSASQMAFPAGVVEGEVRDRQASHCPGDKAEDEG
jgi:hypothetical protein